MKTNLINFVLLLAVLSACSPSDPNQHNVGGGSIFVLNEGNFSWGNASLSVYNPDSGQIQNLVFETVNDAPLGDVAQSATLLNNLLYIVLNNSGKIVVIDKDHFSYQGKITELVSPRYMVAVNENKAYISDLYDSSLTMIDPANFEKTGSLPLGHSSEEMLFADPWLYVLSWSFDSLLTKIDTRTNEIIAQATVRFQPNSFVMDSDGFLWILSDGGYLGIQGGKRPAFLQKVDAETLETVDEFKFENPNDAPFNLCIDQQNKTLYFINHDIWKVNLSSGNLNPKRLIRAKGRNFYSLLPDPAKDRIYTGDAASYIQDGTLFVFDTEGNPLDSLQVGVNPGFILSANQ